MTGYAHAATLAGGDLAVTLAGQLREAREAIQRVRAWATTPAADRHLADQDQVLALLPPDGAP